MSINSAANYLLITGLLMSLASACVSVNETPEHPTIEVPTPRPTPMPSPGVLAVTLVADPEYNRECQKINPSSMQNQISYRDIIPGKTTSEEVVTMLGSPKEENFQSATSWNYNGFAISLEKGIVDSIQIYDDKDLFVDLRSIVLKYGCPNLIFAIDIGVEPIGHYSIAEFIYHNLGIVFDFGDFPVSLEQTPETIEIFRSQTLDNYLHHSNKINFGPKAGIPILWHDAVK